MTPFKKTILISIIFGSVFLLLIIFGILPLLGNIRNESAELVSANKTLALSQNESKNITQIKKLYESIEPDFRKINGFLIDPQTPIDFIKFLEKIAGDSGVSINITPLSLNASKTDPWNSMGFQLTLSGPFSNFMVFLKKIENSPYLTEVQGLALSAEKPGEAKQSSIKNISASLVLKVFTSKP